MGYQVLHGDESIGGFQATIRVQHTHARKGAIELDQRVIEAQFALFDENQCEHRDHRFGHGIQAIDRLFRQCRAGGDVGNTRLTPCQGFTAALHQPLDGSVLLAIDITLRHCAHTIHTGHAVFPDPDCEAGV